MRSTIFYMLRELGVQNLRAVTVSERVLSLVRQDSYDIIMLGHNSSDAVTGIQLLEEARYRGYIRPTAGWLFMTSDASQEVVLHAIDSHPDDLLTKPFSVDELKQRLDMLVRRKQVLYKVEKAIEFGDLESAVECCDEISPAHPCYDYACRLKAQCLLDLKRPQLALEGLEKLFWQNNDKDTSLLMARALYDLEHNKQAEELLLSLIDSFPLLIAAYDLLAAIYERTGDLEAARDTLRQATVKAPLGIPRQMELGRVAARTDAYDVAEVAYRKSIILGRSSCYRSPEPYLRLANIRRLEMQGAEERKQMDLRNDLDILLQNAEFVFPRNLDLKVKTALLRAQVCQDLNEEDDAEKFLQQAKLHNAKLETPLDLDHERLVVSGNEVPRIDLGNLPQEGGDANKRDTQMSIKVNRLGIKHYTSGKWSQAIRYFGLAIEYDPAYSPALLNLAQLYLESARDHPDQYVQRLKMMDRYLRLTSKLPLEEAEKARHEELTEYRQQPIEQLPEGPLGVLLP